MSFCGSDRSRPHARLEREPEDDLAKPLTPAAPRREVVGGVIHCLGIRPWRRHMVSAFLGLARSKVVYSPTLEVARRRGVESGGGVLVWANAETPALSDFCNSRNLVLWRMEDGFLRSVGLGSEFVPPKSLVLDSLGIYYDSSRQSDLEQILQEFCPDEAMLSRAERLARRIVDSGVSKYNAEKRPPPHIEARVGQTVILIPGQVSDDASIARGSPELRSNAELVERVRQENPGAYIIYKMHPDVVFGRRKDGISPQLLARCVDKVVMQAGIDLCLNLADEVHTMTSLTGFEALMRGKPVVTYGQPFYAGWGLTRDRLACARRSRHLTLSELVAGALIEYPRYYDWDCRRFTTPEDTLEALAIEKGRSTPWYEKSPLARRLYARYRMIKNAARYAPR